MADPVRLYAADDQRLPRTVAARLMKHRADLVDAIAYGSALDWPDYQKRVGVLQGIDIALQVCEEATKEFSGD